MNAIPANSISTIGHSNHSWGKFIALLQAAGIETVIDIRSNPRSRFAHFNRAPLTALLTASNIAYRYFGEELGGRSSTNDTIDYEATAVDLAFLEALRRISEIGAKSRSALMCSEHEPLACHRFLLVSRGLAERDFKISHILRDGRIERHSDAEHRLLALTGQSGPDLLVSRSDRLASAYRVQAAALQRKR